MKYLLLCLFVCSVIVEAKRKKPKNEDIFIPSEARLYKSLIDNYGRWNPDRVLIPVFNTSETQNVKFGVALIMLERIEEETSTTTLNLWERYLWNDPLLRWNPEEFDGINIIRVPASRIWRPDIVLFNGFDPDPTLEEALAVISSDGTVLYIPRTKRRVLCSTDNNDGTVYCRLKYGSWTYDGFRLDMDFYDGLEEVDLSDYIHDNTYELIDAPAVKNVKYYPCCVEPYVDLTFSLTFKKADTSIWGK